MFEGHIRLFRRLRKAPYYQDSQYIHLWVHLLLSVNWASKRIKLKDSDTFVDVNPGQILTSRKVISKETGIQVSKVERILKALENEQQVEQQTFSKYRIITITNWGQYQQVEQQVEQQVNSKRTASEQQVNTKKNIKNLKKESMGEMFEICVAWKAFVEMRKVIKKPMTEYAMKLRANDLMRLFKDGHDPVAVLNQSVGNNYQDLYPVKEKNDEKQAASKNSHDDYIPNPKIKERLAKYEQ